MAWSQLTIDKPHLVYIILGGFTSIFMLCSLFIKEKLYIGEATVATICGVIFGPHAANLIDPGTWGNTDKITLEFSRIVLVVQCFAVGVELPKSYMERHWRSVVFLLVPVMTFGWLMTSLFVWWMIVPLSWLESLTIAACVTATDPVLASSVVGKGKFAKRVPKHLRDVLSAESGCNDGMAFPFIYLSLYLIRYNLSAKEVTYHWICYVVLYECIFGAIYGVLVGYIARHAIKWAERNGLIDRESFLVFYFVLALFCAGSGSLLGMDDLLIGFAAGVGFSNDGWFTEKTEESHVSNVIDLLLNLAYFVYFGTIVPWEQYNQPQHGITPWRLVVIALMVVFFRRIPAMLMCKPFIPDIKTWREALFAGHFGPIGVGAIFAAILARAELETDSAQPLAVLPTGGADYELIYLVWPVVTFLVMTSIIVHGSSIAVFTLGRRINTLTITLSYTQGNENGASWMNRLPRITSQSKSMARSESSLSIDEKLPVPPGELPPVGVPKLHLRRMKEDEYDGPGSRPGSRPSSVGPFRRRKKKDLSGGPISDSAIMPKRRSEPTLSPQESGSDTLAEKSEELLPEDRSPRRLDRPSTGSATASPERDQPAPLTEGEERRKSRSRSPPRGADVEAFQEGDDLIIEDEEGNVLRHVETQNRSEEEKKAVIEEERAKLAQDKSGRFTKKKNKPHPKTEGEEIEHDVEEAVEHPQKAFKHWRGFGKRDHGESSKVQESSKREELERKRGPAHAYQFGNTIIVEDEDGEVIKKYTLPGAEKGEGSRRMHGGAQTRHGLKRMGTWVGVGKKPGAPKEAVPAEPATEPAETSQGSQGPLLEMPKTKDHEPQEEHETDDGLRMTISRTDRYGLTGLQRTRGDTGTIELGSGRRLNTKDFLKQMQQLDPKSKIKATEESDAPEQMKREIVRDARAQSLGEPSSGRARSGTTPSRQAHLPEIRRIGSVQTSSSGRPEARKRAQSEVQTYFAPVRPETLRQPSDQSIQSAASEEEEEAEEEDVPHNDIGGIVARYGRGQTAADARRKRLSQAPGQEDIQEDTEEDPEQETAAEKRRRLAALGLGGQQESSDSEEDELHPREARAAIPEPDSETPVESPVVQRPRIQWGGEHGREGRAEPERDVERGEDRGAQHTGLGKVVKGLFRR